MTMDNDIFLISPYLCSRIQKRQNLKYTYMMNKGLWMTIGLLASLSAHAVSLKECQQMAHDNYPAIKQYKLIDRSRDFTLANVAKGWLPQVSASAGAYAFTDILKTNEQMERMGIDMKNWLANASVTIRQNVYDGGQMGAKREVASAQADVQRHQLDVSMYSIGERIDQLYFGILLLDEQLYQNELLLKDLSTSEQTIRSMMKGGIANPTDLDAILVEKLKTAQQGESLAASRKAYLRMLSVFIGKDLAENEKLEKPDATASWKAYFYNSIASQGTATSNDKDLMTSLSTTTNNGKWSVSRPELSYYASQSLLLDAQRKQLDARLRPTVSLFGLGVMHSKVSDMVNNGLLAGGVSVAWNIGALYTRKNDIKKLEIQRSMIDSQRETFLFNNRLQNEEADGNIASLRKQISQDDEIVRLRENIRSKADKKVQLGTESVNELVRDINAVSLARAQRAQHEILLLKEIYKQKNINNQ